MPAAEASPPRAAPAWPRTADAIIVGGGFYGCSLALFLRSVFDRVAVIEARDRLLTRASFVNQARIHTGFHYPRSFVTARRSLALYQRFMADFRQAVVDDFTMLYAIARHGSKITPQRFEVMFTDLGAPIERASGADRALFDPAHVAEVFRCGEFSFDANKLRDILDARLDAAGVAVLTGSEVTAIDPAGSDLSVRVAGRDPVTAPVVIDATYGQFSTRDAAGAGALPFKYEMTEIALIDPPGELAGLGVTVMDGPFFSVMPFPARGCHSLTHVRYTPHNAWTARDGAAGWAQPEPASHWLHMQRDAARYLPCLGDLRWRGSLYEVKTVLLRNERDDGRPILLARDPRHDGRMTVLGGKLDNIYDLFEAIRAIGGPYGGAHTGYLTADVPQKAAS